MRRLLGALVAFAATAAGGLVLPAPSGVDAAPSQERLSPVIGSGSTYAALAINQWKSYAQTRRWDVSYNPIGSPRGLGEFSQNRNDFAGTEAEFSSLGQADQVSRGFQYTPDVAGAIAIAYNVDDAAGNHVSTLRLSRRTIARIFIGDIRRWSDPAIAADNGGRTLPDRAITVYYRGGQSGTTALFYDFVQHTVPDRYGPWARANGFRTDARIIQLDTSPGFIPGAQGLSGNDQQAQAVASSRGKWSITYVEASYAYDNHAEIAWVQNQSGNWTQPSAQSITSALESAGLRGDISQDLSVVYVNPASDGYPISAYSYLMTQCAPTPVVATCRGRYTREGKENTLELWLRYIACEGQAEMGRGVKGYAPLPPHLSQEIANSIARMTGGSPERLTRANCRNPRFNPNFRLPSSPPPPELPPIEASGGATDTADGPGETTGSGSTGGSANSATTDANAASGSEVAAGVAGEGAVAVGGGSTDWREADPTSYTRSGLSPIEKWAFVAVVAIITAPVLGGVVWGLVRRRPT
jgi:phosphate transport system substrate-binding protein